MTLYFLERDAIAALGLSKAEGTGSFSSLIRYTPFEAARENKAKGTRANAFMVVAKEMR